MEPELRLSPYLQEDWIFAVVLAVLAALAWIRYTYPRRMSRLATALIRVRVLFQLMREEMVMSHRTAVTLFLIFSITSGLTLYVAAKSFSWPMTGVMEWWLFPLLSLSVAAVYLWKIITVKVVQFIFGANGGLSEYLSYSFVMNALLGIIWLPFIVLASVMLPETTHWVLWLAGGIFALAWLTRIIQGVLFAVQERVFPLYIFLYLCALEILPLAVIAKGVAEVRF